jgi:hypothetical protein
LLAFPPSKISELLGKLASRFRSPLLFVHELLEGANEDGQVHVKVAADDGRMLDVVQVEVVELNGAETRDLHAWKAENEQKISVIAFHWHLGCANLCG